MRPGTSRPMTSRRAFLQGLGLLGTLPWLAGCGPPAEPLRIAAGIWQGYEPLFMAQREGWLDPQLARVVELPSNAGSLRALRAGVVEGAALTLDEVLRERDKGLALTVVLVFNVSAGADMLLARPAIRRAADLRGRRIGRAQGTNADLLLTVALAEAGLLPSDVTLVELSIGDQWQAWQRDAVDAVITYEPVASRLLAAGARRLFDTSQAPNTIVDVLALRSDVLADPTRRAAIRALTAAHFRGRALLEQQPAAAARRMAPHLGLTEAQVLPSFEGLLLPDLAGNHAFLGGARPGLVTAAERLVITMRTAGLLARAVDLDALVSDAFLPAPGPA